MFSAHDYLMTQFRVIVTYLRLLALPVGQNLEHDYPLYNSFFSPQCSFVSIPLIPVRRGRLPVRALPEGGSAYLALIATGVLWFFTTISVESSIVPIKDIMFEHRLYLPGVGAAIAASAAIFLSGLSKSPAQSAMALPRRSPGPAPVSGHLREEQGLAERGHIIRGRRSQKPEKGKGEV